MGRREMLFAPLERSSRRELFFLCGSAALALLLCIADQGSKLWIERSFALHESRPIIEGWLSFTSVRNQGAAWSILSGHGWLLLCIAVLALAAMLRFFRSLTEGYPERYIAVFMVASGIFGNSIDRLWRGSVVDFIDVHYFDVWRYPVFNIADIAICTGVGIFVLSSFLRPEKKKRGTSDADR